LEDEALKQFRNSIYNFNRKGYPKEKARVKFFESAYGEFDENRNTGLKNDMAYMSEEDQEAFKRYQETMGKVDEFIKHKK